MTISNPALNYRSDTLTEFEEQHVRETAGAALRRSGRRSGERVPSPSLLRRLAIEQGLERPRRFRRVLDRPEILRALRSVLQIALRITGLRERGRQNALRPVIRHLRLAFPTLPTAFAGIRILHLSDLHADIPIPLVDRVIERVRGLAVDLCLLTGDYRFEASGSCDRACEAMAKILAAVEAPLGVFGVLGNHDPAEMVGRLGQFGASILVNDTVEIRRGQESIHLVGVDDPHYYGCDDLTSALFGVPREAFKILLAHSPELASEASAARVNLYLCGHTHAGQICLPWIGPMWVNATCPRQFTRGSWKYLKMLGFTSAGVGCSLVPARFHCPPEIAVIELVCPTPG